MKKTFLFIAIILCFVACNKIEGPFIQQSQRESVDVVFPELDRNAVYRKILFDEYTGHKCTNCPAAHNKVKMLLSQYGDTLVVVCIHAGSNAIPSEGDFSYDFRTETGNQLNADFPNQGVPCAVINRINNISYKPTWDNDLQNADRSLHAAIQIINQYDASSNNLKINTRTTMLEEYGKATQLSLLLVEDSVVKPQEFNNYVVDYNYAHQHVLRTGINGNYGEKIIPGGILEKDSSYLYGYTLNFNGTDWNPDNCSVIAILLDGISKEVLQVEKAKVR